MSRTGLFVAPYLEKLFVDKTYPVRVHLMESVSSHEKWATSLKIEVVMAAAGLLVEGVMMDGRGLCRDGGGARRKTLWDVIARNCACRDG